MVAYGYQEPLSCRLLRQSQLMTGWRGKAVEGRGWTAEERMDRLNMPETVPVLRQTNGKRQSLARTFLRGGGPGAPRVTSNEP